MCLCAVLVSRKCLFVLQGVWKRLGEELGARSILEWALVDIIVIISLLLLLLFPFPIPCRPARQQQARTTISNHLWYYGLLDATIVKNISDSLFIWGEPPTILGGSERRAGPGLQPGLQMRLDVVTNKLSPRYNPSIVRLPAESPLSSFGAYLGVVRVDNDAMERSVNLVQEGDVATYWTGSMDVGNGFISDHGYAGHERPGGSLGFYSYLEAILLDEDLNVLAQTPVRLLDHTIPRLEDCRLLFLGPRLYLYASNYFAESGEDSRSFGAPTDLSSTIRPMEYRLRATRTGRVIMTDFVIPPVGQDETIIIDQLVPLPGSSMNPPPPKGKNHMVLQKGNELFLLDQLNPRRLWRIVNTTHVEYIPDSSEAAGLRDDGPPFSDANHYHLSGGKMVWLPQTKEYLGMVHIHRDYNERSGHWGEHYTQAFFTLAGAYPFDFRRLSPEFCFQSAKREQDCEAVQFSPNIELHDDVLLIAYGAMDLEAMAVTVSLSTVLDSLRPVGNGGFKASLSRPTDLYKIGEPFNHKSVARGGYPATRPPDLDSSRAPTATKKTFVFGASVESAELLQEFFLRHGCNCNLMGDGWDPEQYDCVVDTYGIQDFKNTFRHYPDGTFILPLCRLETWVADILQGTSERTTAASSAKDLQPTCRKLVHERQAYVESVLNFFRNKPDQLIIVSMDEPGWEKFLGGALGYPDHRQVAKTRDETVLVSQDSRDLQEAIAQASEDLGYPLHGKADFVPRTCAPMMKLFEHNIPPGGSHPLAPHPPLRSSGPYLLVDSAEDYRPTQGFKGLFYEISEISHKKGGARVTWVPFQSAFVGEETSPGGAGMTYRRSVDQLYPYVARSSMHPAVEDDRRIMVARVWRSDFEGVVVLKGSVELVSKDSLGDGIEVFVEVDGAERKRYGRQEVMPSHGVRKLTVRTTVKPGTVVRFVVHPRSSQDFDMVYTYFMISRLS